MLHRRIIMWQLVVALQYRMFRRLLKLNAHMLTMTRGLGRLSTRLSTNHLLFLLYVGRSGLPTMESYRAEGRWRHEFPHQPFDAGDHCRLALCTRSLHKLGDVERGVGLPPCRVLLSPIYLLFLVGGDACCLRPGALVYTGPTSHVNAEDTGTCARCFFLAFSLEQLMMFPSLDPLLKLELAAHSHHTRLI
jgi:hypothetical protein